MRVNNYNSAAIVAAQEAFASCGCEVCSSPVPRRDTCSRERELWAELERGEDEYLAALSGGKGGK